MKFVDCFMIMGTAFSFRTGKKYPEMQRPFIEEVTVTNVNVSVDITEMQLIDRNQMDFQVSFHLNQEWIDPRLGANEGTNKLAVLGQIWKPKILPANGLNRICENENFMFWRGYGDEGHVVLNEKLSVKIFCSTDFRNFPFDKQICELKFSSYRFPMEEVALRWQKNPIQILTDPKITDFQLTNVTTYNLVDIRRNGNFSLLLLKLEFKRQSTHYFLCIIIPCFFAISLNYFSLWITLHKRLLRYQFQIASIILLLLLYYISVCGTFPQPFLKALDIFVVFCLAFSILSVAENYVVDHLCKNEEEEFHLKNVASKWEYPDAVLWLEFVVKLSYPLFFAFFVVVYLIVYLIS